MSLFKPTLIFSKSGNLHDKKHTKSEKQQEIQHILTILEVEKLYMLAFAIKKLQILMFSKNAFQKRSKFCCFMRFPSFSFLEEKSVDFLCVS